MSRIEEIYYEYIETGEVQDDQKVKKAMAEFEKILGENDVEKKLQNMLINACISYSAENERQGFIYGFTCATQIMCEVFQGK